MENRVLTVNEYGKDRQNEKQHAQADRDIEQSTFNTAPDGVNTA